MYQILLSNTVLFFFLLPSLSKSWSWRVQQEGTASFKQVGPGVLIPRHIFNVVLILAILAARLPTIRLLFSASLIIVSGSKMSNIPLHQWDAEDEVMKFPSTLAAHVLCQLANKMSKDTIAISMHYKPRVEHIRGTLARPLKDIGCECTYLSQVFIPSS